MDPARAVEEGVDVGMTLRRGAHRSVVGDGEDDGLLLPSVGMGSGNNDDLLPPVGSAW